MSTGIYQGRVFHSRTKCVSSPAEHSFAYPVWMALVDLEQVEDRIETVPRSFLCSFDSSSSSWALTRWRRTDHFGENPRLSEDVRALVLAKTQLVVTGRIELLTNLSFAGRYNFNPVSVYYCYDSAASLVACVLEVSNTPWLDKRMYVLRFDGTSFRMSWEKDFHVSPFMDTSHYYDWVLAPPLQGKLHIQAFSKRKDVDSALVAWDREHVQGGQTCTFVDSSSLAALPTSFVVKLDLERVPWDRVWRTILGNPVMPLAAVLWIHIEAFRVWYKGVSYVTPPPGSRLLEIKDAAVHLVVFLIAAVVRYGIVLPVQLVKRLITALKAAMIKEDSTTTA